MPVTTKRAKTAIAEPNIAFIKYWGNRNHTLRIPSNGSLSMNLEGLETRTSVTFDPALPADRLTLNGQPVADSALVRVSAMLERVRGQAGTTHFASVSSTNNFPMGAGIASSASAMAALALAASAAAGLELPEKDLSILARTGSGSASRSVPGGFVEWQAGSSHEDSFAFSIAPPEHWDLVDLVAVVHAEHKATGSTAGHVLAESSPLQAARVADAPRRIEICRRAILEKDFPTFAGIVELDINMMHAVMMTSTPPLVYWKPATLAVMESVGRWRDEGAEVCYTIDAGPNVHVICTSKHHQELAGLLRAMPGVRQVLEATPGGPTRLVPDP